MRLSLISVLLVPIAIVGCSRASSSVAPSHSTPNGIVLVTSVPSASPSGTPSSAQVETYLTVATSADTAYLVWNSALAGASRPSLILFLKRQPTFRHLLLLIVRLQLFMLLEKPVLIFPLWLPITPQ